MTLPFLLSCSPSAFLPACRSHGMMPLCVSISLRRDTLGSSKPTGCCELDISCCYIILARWVCQEGHSFTPSPLSRPPVAYVTDKTRRKGEDSSGTLGEGFPGFSCSQAV